MPRAKGWLCLVLAAGLVLTTACSDDDDPAAVPDPLSEQDFVFVDGANGRADGAGTRQDPLADLQAGIDLAAGSGRDVCVAQGTYAVDSSAGAPFAMAAGVSLFGGYANAGGAWSRDPAAAPTVLQDTATAGGTGEAPNAAVACTYGHLEGPAPVIDGFVLVAGGGERAGAVFVGPGASVTIRGCEVEVGDAANGYGVVNYSLDRDGGTLLTVQDTRFTGGGGQRATAIQVYRGDVTLQGVEITGLTATSTVFGVDIGYGDFIVADCVIDGGTAPGSTRALYLNQAFTSAVTGCTLHGGRGGTASYAIQAMDTEDASAIAGNLIDGGEGDRSVGLELGWVETNPAVDGNVFRSSGGAERFGIMERDNVADPVSLTNNVFDGSLLAGTGTSVFYRDQTGGVVTDVVGIAELNGLDEAGLNPAGSVAGNEVATSARSARR